MSTLDRLKKTVEALKAVTAGRHPASPGVSAKPAADPGTPPDRPHIREDAMKEVNFRMEKAETPDDISNRFAAAPIDPKPEFFEHIGTKKLKNGMFHHAYKLKPNAKYSMDVTNFPVSDRYAPGYHFHVISQSDKPFVPGIAGVEGSSTGMKSGGFEIWGSRVSPSHKGQNLGKLAYFAAADHHGNVMSGPNVSQTAAKVYESAPKMLPGVIDSSMVPNTDYKNRHFLSVKNPDALREHLYGTPEQPWKKSEDFILRLNAALKKAVPTPDPDGKSVMEEKERHLQSANTPHLRQSVGGKPKMVMDKAEPGTPPIAPEHADNRSLTWKTRLNAVVGALRKAAYDPRKEITGFEDPEELAAMKGRHKVVKPTPSDKMLGLFGNLKEKPDPKKTPKVLKKNADKGVSLGGTPSLISLLKKADKISDGIMEQANPESAYQGKPVTPIKPTAYKRRFEFTGKDSNDPQLLSLPKENFDKIETTKTPEGLYHHVGTKGNHQYHTISFSSNPTVPANAGAITAESNGKRHLRAAFSAAGTNVYLEKLADRMKSNDNWKYENALAINARDHAEKGWGGLHSDLLEGLVPDKTLQAPPSTVSKWISFAGKEGDSTPRVVAKEALENFDADEEKGVDQMRRSFFGHPKFTTAHREAAYGQIANDVFKMGQYVPRTTVFRHPLSNRPWSAMEFIAGAKPITAEDAPEKLKELKDNGDIYKLAIMNMILGNNDRHMNNILIDPAGKPHLIDHGLTFDYSHITTDVLPQYAQHVLDEPIPESVHQWLWSIDSTQLANELHKMGAPVPIVMNAVGRLADARGWSNLIKHGSKLYDAEIKHRGLRYLLETMKARQLGIPVETRYDIQERIRRDMTGIKPAAKPAEGDKTIKMDDHPVHGSPVAQPGEATVKINEQTGKATIVHPKNETALRHTDAVDTRRNKE